MQLTIISDCRDDNARARQQIRYKTLLGELTQTFIGVNDELEAQGELIDTIDAHKDSPGVIVVNVAPRGNKEKYPNGVPFSFHRFGKAIIIGTANCFPLAKKLGMFSKTFQTDVREVCNKFLSEKESERISESQFRSYEYLPYLTKWVLENKDIPCVETEINDFGSIDFVWYIDCFGNCKTTSIESLPDLSAYTPIKINFFEKLSDVPKGTNPAFIRGSSGYKERRFIEVVIQRGSACEHLGLRVGSRVRT